MLEVVRFPFCTAVLVESWNAPPGRFFVAYLARGDFRWLAGHAVVDEFATLSSPVFLTPRALLGKIYNAGISLGHRRDPKMALDLGWPPLCVGLGVDAPELAADWERQLLEGLTEPYLFERVLPAGVSYRKKQVGDWMLETLREAEATVIATSAPLLPRQLQQLCEASVSSMTIAVATGNRLGRPRDHAPVVVRAVSQAKLDEIVAVAEGLAR